MKTFTNYAEKKAKQFFNLLQGYTKGIRITAILILLLMGTSNAWGLGYNNESHVYLDVNGTTKYYKVSSESWSTGCSLPGTWGGELKNQTFNDVQNLTIKGGAVGGWTNSGETLSATLSYAVTTNTNTPSSWTNFGSVSSNHTNYSGNNAFYYKNDGSTDVTPTTPGTYYLHIKIAFNSTSKTSYAKFTIPEPPTYTVAGSEAVLGSNWNQSDTNNDMTLSSGTIYTLTKYDVSLTKGTNYECKVVQDHNWDKAWPNSNYSFTVQTTGHYDVTFTFDSSNKSIEVTTTRLYALTYDGNGSTSGSVPTTEYHKSGTNITVANNSGNLAKSGYTFEGWNENADGTGTSYAVGSTFSMPSADKTLYAKWTEKTYSVTISAGTGGTVSPLGSKTIGQVTKTTVTATPDANYEFVNWTATGGVVVANTTSASTTITATAAGTLKANFRSTATNSLTVAAGAGIASVTGSTDPVTLGSTYAITATPKTGYTFSTWTANPAANATFGSATTANTTVTVNNGSVTVTATATENTHDVTVSYKYGSTTIKDNTTTTAVGEANAKSITAPSITGYTFKEWTLGDGITNKSANTTTSTISITTKKSGNYTLTAVYDVIPCNFLYGSSTPLNSTTDGGKMSYDPNEKAYYIDVTTNNKPYYFQFYYNNSTKWAGDWNGNYPNVHEVTANGDKVDCNQDVTNWDNKASLRFEGESGSAIRVWFDYVNKKAWITEKTYSVTISAGANGSVNPSGTQQVGASGLSVTATANTGYKFKNWTVTDGAQVTDANSATTTVTATAEGTITANFEEDLSTGWYLAGEFSNNGDGDPGWNAKKVEFQKISGQSTGTVSYITMDLLPTTFTDDYKMSFKIVNGNTWYGNNGTYKKANNKQQWQFETGKDNCYLEVSLPGTYTFRLQSDSTDSKKYISIVYPIVNQLQVYTANPAHNAAIANWDWDSQNGDVYTKTLSLNANTDYTFKAVINSAFYGKATTLTRVSSSATLNTSDGNVTLSTDIAGDYIFTFNASNNQLAITYPDYTIVPIYLNLSDFTDWEKDNASFKIKYDNITTTFTQIGCSHYYTCEAPQEKNITIFRTDGASEWNPISTIVPTNANNCFKVTGWTTGSWSTYTEPTHDITINAPESGTITVTIDGNTTTVTNEATTIEDVALNAQMTVNYIPNNGYIVGKAHIIIGTNDTISTTTSNTYTVCGPTEITAYFVTEKDQVVYLRPTDAWLADNARFAAYAFNRYAGTAASQWIELTTKDTDYTGAFSCTIPAGFSHVIFVRINPTAAEPSWNNNVKWNQSVDYVIPVNTTNNRFIIGEKVISGGDEGKYQGSWEASNKPIYGIPGDWQGTDTWAADQYPLMGPDGEVTVNITQTNDTLGFKVYQYPYGSNANSEQWLGNDSTMVRGGEGVHEGGWPMETDKNNCGLGVDIAGDYVFHFNIRESKLTVQYPPMPVPSTITPSAQRIFEDAPLDWIAGNGTEANPYQLYVDETARITITGLADVPGLMTCYRVGDNEEQTSNIIDFTNILTEDTAYTVYAYYKNATGATSDTVTVQTPYIKGLPMPFYLMTSPSQEINIDRIKAGENILVQFRSDAAATVGLYLQINDGVETKLTDITNTISTDYTHDVDNNIAPCVLHYIARSTATVNSRTFEAKADVAIYKNVIIKVHDPDGWVKNAYMWRDYSDAVKTQWPGEPVLQNFGTWRVFSVKYPYYDRFIVNDGNAGNSTQTIDWVLPDDDTCYELLDPADNGSSDPADTGKYGLQEAGCPENLLVEDIKDTTIMEGEQIVVMPKIYVGLGYQVADIEASVSYDDPTSIKAMMSGTNVTILGNAEGESNVTVTYILDNVRIEKTFTVTVTKKNKITIQVKVPIASGGTYDNIGWSNNDLIKIHYWFTGKEGDIPLRYVYEEANKFKYLQAEVPLDAEGKTNFLIGYDDINENWEKTADILNVETDGCYTLKNAGWGNSPTATLDGIVCWDENDYAQYQVKILMGNGKAYTSNIVNAPEDTLSFFAPGMNETGYKAGVVMLYQNDKMIATIEPSNFTASDVYIATLNDALNGLDNVSTYSGNFYIRTYGTSHANIGFNNGKGWNSIKDLTAVEKDSVRFTKFTSREGEFYNHYWVQAMNTGNYGGKDVSACVANEYNDDLAGKLTKGKGTDEYGDIKVDGTGTVINVRFGYDPRTNYFGRAIIKGSGDDNYLNIHCDNAYKDKNCSTKLPYGTSDLENKMQDISNWVYQRDFYVPINNSHPSASLYVEATSPSTTIDVTDHLLGYVTNEITGEATTTPIQKTVIGSGTTNGTYLIRVVYDFKTNRLIAAWVPQGTIEVSTEKTINADVLFVRKENEDVPQINLSNQGKIKSLESMFFAMELHRIDKDPANRQVEQYWFTLPFDCEVGSISGVHGYLQIWGIQRYRGDLRAQKGWYAETPTFWEWMDIDDVMHAGEGYLLVFDKKNAPWNEIDVDKTDANGNIIEGQKDTISLMRLYFPSTTSGFDMQQQSEEQLTRTYENHTCTLTLHDRYLQDSNWKVIGTTSYNNAGITGYTVDTNPEYEEFGGTEAPNFRYSYDYDWENGTFNYEYTPENGKTATYKSFYGYMVQFAGTISWQPIMSETVPEGIAARRYVPADERTSFTTRLEIANAEGEKQDQTFVALDEKATTTFDQNLDLNKVMNSHKANIYTLSEGIPFAGNTLPMEKATVPVGVRVATAGEYTFRMPDGTDGISVTLVDNVTGTHTDMLMDEYTITLDAGTCENRFYLVVDPDRTATSVENIGEEAKGEEAKDQIKKFLIDGKLFIRTADGTFDAKGQRL